MSRHIAFVLLIAALICAPGFRAFAQEDGEDGKSEEKSEESLSAPERFIRGWRAFREGNLELAITQLRYATAKRPKYVDAHYLLGQVYQFRAAKRNRLEIKNLRMSAAETVYVKKYLKGLDDLRRAVSHFEIVLELQPKAADALFDLATCLDNLGREDKAIKTYNKIFKIAPETVHARNAYNNLGLLYAAQEKYDKARECYKKALEIDPTFHTARFNLDRVRKKSK